MFRHRNIEKVSPLRGLTFGLSASSSGKALLRLAAIIAGRRSGGR